MNKNTSLPRDVKSKHKIYPPSHPRVLQYCLSLFRSRAWRATVWACLDMFSTLGKPSAASLATFSMLGKPSVRLATFSMLGKPLVRLATFSTLGKPLVRLAMFSMLGYPLRVRRTLGLARPRLLHFMTALFRCPWTPPLFLRRYHCHFCHPFLMIFLPCLLPS